MPCTATGLFMAIKLANLSPCVDVSIIALIHLNGMRMGVEGKLVMLKKGQNIPQKQPLSYYHTLYSLTPPCSLPQRQTLER